MVDAVVQVGGARARVRCQEVVASLAACLDLVALKLPRRIVAYRATPGCVRVCCATPAYRCCVIVFIIELTIMYASCMWLSVVMDALIM